MYHSDLKKKKNSEPLWQHWPSFLIIRDKVRRSGIFAIDIDENSFCDCHHYHCARAVIESKYVKVSRA